MKNQQPKHNVKKALLVGSGAFLTFAISAAGAFFLVPQTVITNTLKPVAIIPGGVELTNTQRFLSGLTASAQKGLDITIDNLDIHMPGNTREIDGVSHTGDNHFYSIPGKPMEVKFGFTELSISGISATAKLPIGYNDIHRELDLGLVGGEADKTLYFSINDIEGDVTPDWSAGYQVSLASYIDAEAGQDPLTGGDIRYEYGRLDWVIHDIVEILTEGGFNLSTYGKIESLISGSGMEESQEESSSSLSMGDITEALNTIEETVVDGLPYFTLDLPLGDFTYSIGFRSDEDLTFRGLDIPAKTSDKETQSFIKEDWTLALSATVSTSVSEDFWKVPDAWKAYPRLDDSAALFEWVASLVADPRFGFNLDVSLHHQEDGVEGTYTTVGKEAIDELAVLSVSGNADIAWKKNEQGYKSFKSGIDFKGIGADVSFVRHEKDAFGAWHPEGNGQHIGVKYSSRGTDADGIYLNVADVLKARTTKTVLDDLMGQFQGVAEEGQEGKSLNEIVDLVEKIIKLVRGSSYTSEAAIIGDLRDGSYEDIAKVIESLSFADNQIRLVLNLKGLGFYEIDEHGEETDAKVIVTLDGTSSNGTYNAPLLDVEIENLQIASLGIDVSLKTADFVDPTPSEEEVAYDKMTHLPGLVEQFKGIAEDKKVALDIQGDVTKEGKESVLPGVAQGLGIEGEMAFDFSGELGEVEEHQNPISLQGGANIALTQRGKDYFLSHNVALDVENTADAWNDDANMAYIHYDSGNAGVSEEDRVAQKRTNPEDEDGLNAKIGVKGLSSVLDLLSRFSEDADNRFSKIARLFSNPAEASLLSDLTGGNYFKLADLEILDSAHIGEDEASFVLKGDSLGLDGKLAIGLGFTENTAESYGKLESLSVSSVDDLDKDDQTLFDIELRLKDASAASYSFIEEEKKQNATDLTGIFNLVDYLGETALLGLNAGEGISTYDIEGGVALALGKYEAQIAKAHIAASVEGARVKAFGELNDIPVIRGINAPDDPRYFRELELGGQRDAAFYYYSDGLKDLSDPILNKDNEVVGHNLTSKMLFTRHTDYGRLANVNDSLRLDHLSEIKADTLNYFLEYFLGVNQNFFESETNSSEVSKESKPFHVEDLLKSFAETTDGNGGISWKVGVSLNSLLGIDILDDITLEIRGGSFENNGNVFKSLNALKVTAGVSLAGNTVNEQTSKLEKTGDRLSIVKASIDFAITNLDETGYRQNWDEIDDDYQNVFLTFAEDGSYVPGSIFGLTSYEENPDDPAQKRYYHSYDTAHQGKRNYYLGVGIDA